MSFFHRIDSQYLIKLKLQVESVDMSRALFWHGENRFVFQACHKEYCVQVNIFTVIASLTWEDVVFSD